VCARRDDARLVGKYHRLDSVAQAEALMAPSVLGRLVAHYMLRPPPAVVRPPGPDSLSERESRSSA
jgi:hypothetical protein